MTKLKQIRLYNNRLSGLAELARGVISRCADKCLAAVFLQVKFRSNLGSLLSLSGWICHTTGSSVRGKAMPACLRSFFIEIGPTLTGKVPAVLGQMPKLRVLDLFGNTFAVHSVIPRPMLTLPAAEKQKSPTSLQVHM